MGGCCCQRNQRAGDPSSAPDDTNKNKDTPKFAPVNKSDQECDSPDAKVSNHSNGTTRSERTSVHSETRTKEQTAAHIALTDVDMKLINVIISETNEEKSDIDRENKETKLPIMNTLTISQMKQLIDKHIGIAEHTQLLKYNDIILENHQTLYFYNIQEGDKLHLIVMEETTNTIKINVDYKSGTIKKIIYVPSDCTLIDFKREVQGKIPNVAGEEQQLFYNDIELLDDEKLLNEYNIINEATLRFEWKSVI